MALDFSSLELLFLTDNFPEESIETIPQDDLLFASSNA